jgi:hypothetical protein
MSEHPENNNPGTYGCHPRHYEHPQVPEGWRTIALHSPAEPSGWYGAARVLLAVRGAVDAGTIEYVTWAVMPSGRCGEGRYVPAYDRDYREAMSDAIEDYERRSAAEDERAARYAAGREVIA